MTILHVGGGILVFLCDVVFGSGDSIRLELGAGEGEQDDRVVVAWGHVCVCPAALPKSERLPCGASSFHPDAVFTFLPSVVTRLGCALAFSPFLFLLGFMIYSFFLCVGFGLSRSWFYSSICRIVVVYSHLRAGHRGAVGKVCGRGCDLAT